MKLQYKKALRYAFVLDSRNYRDHVHSAYLYYHDKTGGNIFEQPEPYMLRCIKFMWKWKLSSETFYKDTKTFNKEIHEYDEAAEIFGVSSTYGDKFNTGNNNPHRDLESKEAVELIRKRVAAYHSGKHNCSLDPGVLVEVMDYLQRGYTGNEIGTMMDISFQTVSNHKKKIQSIIKPLAILPMEH